MLKRFLNGPISSTPPETIPQRAPSISFGSVPCPLETSILQNLFNHLRLADLAIDHQYTCERLSWSLYRGAKLPPGTVSLVLRFTAPGSEVAFDVHGFLVPDGTIAASGMLDPKAIYIPSRYHFLPRT
jgi:hypothetical protein